MTVTVSFAITVASILIAGLIFRRWDESHHLRFTDEVGTARAVPAMARIEARKLALHPAFLITLGIIALTTAAFMILEQDVTIEADRIEYFTFIGVPLGALALVAAAHRNAGRSRRDGTDELFASTPTSPRARTQALLLACLGPVPIALGYLVVARLSLDVVADAPVPVLWPLLLAVVTSILLAVVGGGVVGVFLSRWLPTTAAALAGIAAIIWLNNGPDNHHERFRWLRVAVEKDLGGRFDIVPPTPWRIAFVAGLVGLGACLALWRHPAGRAHAVATTVCVAVVAGSGWVMTRPPSTSAIDQVVSDLERPARRQHCESRNGVQYCVYLGAEGWIDVWSPAVDSVFAATPARARPSRIRIRQRESVPLLDAPVEFNGDQSFPYLDQVVARLDPALAWRADGAVHPSLQLSDDMPDLEVAFGVASAAVGLPAASSWSSPAGCFAPGQARMVLAMWLAGDATETTRRGIGVHAERVRAESTAGQRVSLNAITDYEDRSASGDGFQAVVGAAGTGADVLAADQLVRADHDDVAAAVNQHWSELTDPTTPVSRVFQLAGLPVPEVAATVVGSGTCS